MIGQEEINLTFRFRHLENKDYYLKAYCNGHLIGAAMNMNIVFNFQERQLVEVHIKHDKTLIEAVKFSLGELMGSAKNCLKIKLKEGLLYVKGDRVEKDRECIECFFMGKHLLNTDGMFNKSDPFLRFIVRRDNEDVIVHETEFISDTLDPVWRPFQIYTKTLSPKGLPFKVQCWDHSMKGNHHFIGEIQMTIQDLMNPIKFKLINKEHPKCGSLTLQSRIFFKHSLIDYLYAGDKINLMVCIDYTSSNGKFELESSLHNINHSPYQRALQRIVPILIDYDTDNTVQLFGFGGIPKFPNHNKHQPEHCFPLNGCIHNPNVSSQEVIAYYKSSLKYVELSGPTLFVPLLQQAIQQVKQRYYTVVMILTDGVLHDMKDTLLLLKECSKLPISIVIIGVGDQDFSPMWQLLEMQPGQTRSFVQFVHSKQSEEQLNQSVLGNLPEQFTAYKSLIGEVPQQVQEFTLDEL